MSCIYAITPLNKRVFKSKARNRTPNEIPPVDPEYPKLGDP